jgi:hypothetical protein
VADINIPTAPIHTEPRAAIRPAPGQRGEDASREALYAALHAVELGDYDHQIIGWLCTWEPSTVAVICSWIQRARNADNAQEGA